MFYSCRVVKKNFSYDIRRMCKRVVDIIAYIGRDIEMRLPNLIQRNDLPKDAVKVLGKANDTIITLVTNLLNIVMKNLI